MNMQADQAHGAYGLRITGPADLEEHLVRVPLDWPELRLAIARPDQAAEQRPAGTMRIGEERAELWLADGMITLQRRPLEVRFATHSRLSTDAILHPFLGLPAVIANQWLGRLALHAAGFVCDEGAYALLGPREAGKSSTLAALLRLGCRALTDDVLVVEQERAFAGPRSVDVREDVAPQLGGVPLGVLGSRKRWRLHPPAAPAVVPLSGLIVLAWGEHEVLEPLEAELRLQTLVSSLALVPGEASAPAILPLLALPAWRFTRRRGFDTIELVARRLLGAIIDA